MNDIKSETEYLFGCDYFSDDFDDDELCEHLNRAKTLLKTHKWSEIFDEWNHYLLHNCRTPEEVINFVNLFFYYGGQDEAVKEPYKFLGYLYYMVDMDKYWDDAGDLFDSLSISMLENSGNINIVKNPYYTALEDPKIKSAVNEWKVKKGE
ncbi:MAG: hypothetical protein K5659_00385 [Lachnospiraceae bacterium]|nr:hypothetical protein [Lachnospiraceae bacterium]